MRVSLATAGVLTSLAAFLTPVTAAGAADTPPTGPGNVTDVRRTGSTYTFTTDTTARVRVTFDTADLVRIEAAPDGAFTDPANTPPADPSQPATPIVTKTDWPGAPTRLADRSTYYEIASSAATVRVTKSPLTFTMYDRAGHVLWQETAPLRFSGTATTQTLAEQPDEQFFGGGMPNGSLNHRGQTLQIARETKYQDGNHPNPAPFYVSTKGYGVLRDTYATGTYAFTDPVSTTHAENRFDAYYFVGDFKHVIDRYTELTGRPALPPMYGLEMGLSDCYNEQGRTTADALPIAAQYRQNGDPLGYSIVNDDYLCGYSDLNATGAGLREQDAELGLWTSTGLPNLESEVKDAGLGVYKLDGAWTLPGYRFALSACEQAYNGIQDNSDKRGFVWTIFGWAGTQRCGVEWTGDQHLTWPFIKWHIPTLAGATMSGLAFASSDVGAFYDMDPQMYTRDLEWKTFLPVSMVLNTSFTRTGQFEAKQPWALPEPYKSINHDYLALHERLMPYLYSYAWIAHRTGVGPVRPLVLEYPDDPNTWTDAAAHEFLAGQDFLVAPVYSDTSVRDGIYLPKGTWVDYWTGRTYHGPTTVDGYQAPIDTLPLFVRAGAVVPMWADGTTDWNDRDHGELDLDVYPQGNSTFTVHQDDGTTRAFEHGAYAEQTIHVSAPPSGHGAIAITVGPSVGSYAGKPATQHYALTVHSSTAPQVVLGNRGPLPRLGGRAAFDQAATGWYFDPSEGGTVHVKTPTTATTSTMRVTLVGAHAVE